MVSCMYNMCTSIYTKFLYGWCLLLFILVSDDVMVMKPIPIPKFGWIRIRVSQYSPRPVLLLLHKTRKVRGDIRRFTVFIIVTKSNRTHDDCKSLVTIYSTYIIYTMYQVPCTWYHPTLIRHCSAPAKV